MVFISTTPPRPLGSTDGLEPCLSQRPVLGICFLIYWATGWICSLLAWKKKKKIKSSKTCRYLWLLHQLERDEKEKLPHKSCSCTKTDLIWKDGEWRHGLLSEFLPGLGYLRFLGCTHTTLYLVAKLNREILFSCLILLDSGCLLLILQQSRSFGLYWITPHGLD